MGNGPVSEELFLVDLPLKSLRKELLEWFAIEQRDLPWRKQRSVYGTWISEIMLQQTTVAIVVPYWTKFMVQFPDVQSLAAATESEVLALWSGLGYYRRARNLHVAAKQIMNDFGGVLPSSMDQWKHLAGVGQYASGAIASLGMGQVVPAVDVNARRVVTRFLVDDVGMLPTLKPNLLYALASRLVDPLFPGLWNEALMELGATHCSASNPGCSACPVRKHCRAHNAGISAEIPIPANRRTTVKVVMAQWLILSDQGLVLLPPEAPVLDCSRIQGKVVRDDFSGLHQGLWKLPHTPWFKDAPNLSAEFFLKHFSGILTNGSAELTGCRQKSLWTVGKFSHGITHFRIRVENVAMDFRGMSGGTISNWLTENQIAFVGQDNQSIGTNGLNISFLPIAGNLMNYSPVSKMVDKARLRVEKTII